MEEAEDDGSDGGGAMGGWVCCAMTDEGGIPGVPGVRPGGGITGGITGGNPGYGMAGYGIPPGYVPGINPGGGWYDSPV